LDGTSSETYHQRLLPVNFMTRRSEQGHTLLEISSSNEQMSYVDIAKMLTPDSASGFASDAKTPTCEKSIGPWTFKPTQPRSDCTPSGT
jgi:hypothetical protein